MEQGYSKEGSSVTNQKWLKSVVGCVFQPDLARDGTLVNIVQRIRIEVIPKEVWRGLADFAKPKNLLNTPTESRSKRNAMQETRRAIRLNLNRNSSLPSFISFEV